MKAVVSIIAAEAGAQYVLMEGLARRIVPDFYRAFFAVEAAEYLVESGHTAKALEELAARGSRHFLIAVDGEAVGYFSLHVEGVVMLLSHFYVLAEHRGRGLGTMALAFVTEAARESGVSRIELFVLRASLGAVKAYKKSGFGVVEEVLTRLGNGAVLEDYLMRKVIDN